MSTLRWMSVIFLAFSPLSGIRAYAQSLTEAEKLSWLSLVEANAMLEEKILVDGKEIEPIPNPMFAFPVPGTPIGETGLKIGDPFELSGVLADNKKPYRLEKDEKGNGNNGPLLVIELRCMSRRTAA